ncbi:MAG: multidrug transporter, partial [Verrucomicrobiae bacterium]|nr:multidrug transporter [Verrucomicrobiae bacterium]
MTPLRLIVFAAFTAGCSLAPKYSRPALPVPSAWPTGPAYEYNAATDTNLKWRELFPDTKLQQLISLALTNNRDLRIAALNVERARAIYAIQRDA